MFRFYTRDELFPSIKGNNEQIAQMSQYFLGAADRGSLSERLLLLLGPNGTGKTTMCNDIKQGLIKYSKTESGIAYAITDCPFNQHPFDLIPPEERENHGIIWYQDSAPCPVCEVNLQKNENRWKMIPVSRFWYKPRYGLAEHTASDARREDITEFLGDIDYSMVQKVKGSKANPEAYDWAGKFVWANRGILDWDEILKSRRQLLTPLLMLTQNKTVAYPKFPKLHVDTVIIGATNWGEYKQALKDDLLEPLFGRAFVVEFLYSLDPHEETEIVKLRAKQMQDYSRFKGENTVTCINELILEGYLSELIVTSRKESKGKEGLPPRVTLDIFSNAYMNASAHKETCISIDRYRESYNTILSSEDKKNPDLNNRMGLDTAIDEKVKEKLKLSLWEFIKDISCTSSDEFKRFGQSKYLEYLSIIEKKQMDMKISEREAEFSANVAQLLPNVHDHDSFERIIAERLEEYKKLHYTQMDKLKPAINEFVSEHIKTILKNYAYKADMCSEAEKTFVEDMANVFSSHSGCKKCAHELLCFLGENI